MKHQSEPNVYSLRWFTAFHLPITEGRTIAEVDFVCACAPLPQFRAVADVCCGMGRHARKLSKRGYSVIGVDRDLGMITKARELGSGPNYIQADLREYRPELDSYDVVIVMGQSFGHFDASTNQIVLARLAAGLREGGRLILDLWNPDFFVAHQGERDFDLPEGTVHETKEVRNGRLFVHLTYPGGDEENFAWQLFSRAEMEAATADLGLTLTIACTDFDRSAEPCVSNPRIQFVLKRDG